MVLAISVLFAVQGAAAVTTYTITVSTNASSYASGQQIKITGTVSPAPGPSTGVTIRLFGPTGNLLGAYPAPVAATTGAYNYTVVAGGSSGWTSGTYTVNSTWGAYPPEISNKTTFTYSTGATTTTSSTTSATSTTTTSSTSTVTPTTTTSTSTSTSVTPTTIATTSTQPTTSSSSTAIPEFPYQFAIAGIFVAALAAAYLVIRRSKSPIPAATPPR